MRPRPAAAKSARPTCTEIKSDPNFVQSDSAIATLLDAALSNAARAAIPPGANTATIQFTVHDLEPGRGALIAEGHAIRAGAGVVTAQAHARDASGLLVAQALGTLRVLRPR